MITPIAVRSVEISFQIFYTFNSEDGTLVSLFVPQSINLQDVHKKLNDEEEKASKLARDTQRVHLLDALRMAQRLFNHYDTSKRYV